MSNLNGTISFRNRSEKLERIDTGDYTAEEYELFLKEIRIVNRLAGDARALRKSLIREICGNERDACSILDVGAGSGELLREVARAARRTGTSARLVGLDLNARSVRSIIEESSRLPEISAVRGDVRSLPFVDGEFDFTICSLFAHHFDDRSIIAILKEMSRVSRIRVIVIDLHRHPFAYAAYKLFCAAFRISPLVREDGSLSILRGFKPGELAELANRAGLKQISVRRSAPFRIVLSGK